ncbi:MAG: hypothetical protein OEW90_04330 [Betaproteobacteria bacterium]|nr:hypothetical protein [Betaproteobacteria bacterium]MDH5211012.1 hypothetical protein [Betaproteobacteria bacterium]
MIIRSLLLAALASACAGCVGFAVDIPTTHEIPNPVPLMAKGGGFGTADKQARWACQSDAQASAPLTKNHFLNTWGAPMAKVATAKGETWIYEERNRWCGLWVFVIVPVPVVLPFCDTYDKVSFEGDFAVSSQSRRFRDLVMGIGAHPYGIVPFMSRPGRVTENRPVVFLAPEREKGDLACPTMRPPA